MYHRIEGFEKIYKKNCSRIFFLNKLSCSTQVINGAGHHVYLDKPDLFNKYVLEACSRSDGAQYGDVPRSNDKAHEAEESAATDEPSPTSRATSW